MKRYLYALPLVLLLVAAGWSSPQGAFSSLIISNGDSGYGHIHKFGSTHSVQTADDPNDIWDCHGLTAANLKPYLAGNTTLFISSDDEDDTGKFVTVEGLDGNGALQSSTTALGAANAGGTLFAEVGGTGVVWDRVFRAYADDDTVEMEGNLYVGLDSVTDTGDDGIPDTPTTDIMACTLIGTQQTMMTHWTCPASTSCYLEQWCAGVAPDDATNTRHGQISFKSRVTGKAWRTRDEFKAASSGNAQRCQVFPTPLKFAALTDFRFELTTVTSNGTYAWANYDMILKAE